MTENIGSVLYAENGAINTVIYRLYPNAITGERAHEMLALRAESARFELEEQFPERNLGVRVVPEGTLERHFRPGSFDAIERYRQTVVDDMDAFGDGIVYATSGAVGYLIPDLGDSENFNEGDLLVSVKVSADFDSGSSWRKDARIDHVVVHPEARRQGLGSATVHAALLMGDFDPDGRVLTNVWQLDESSAAFYEDVLGLERRHDIRLPRYKITDGTEKTIHEMPLSRFETPPMLGLRGVLRRLEERKPWLKNNFPMAGPEKEMS